MVLVLILYRQINSKTNNDVKYKKVIGMNEVPFSIIKKVKDHIYLPLTYLIKESLLRGIFPEKLKFPWLDRYLKREV